MAVEPEDDALLLEDQQDEGGNADEGQDEGEEQGSEEAGEQADDESEIITFGDEAAPASGERDTGLVKHLREEIRKRDARMAEMAKAQPQPQKVEIGPKPTLADCDYDEDKFQADFEAWDARRKEAAQAETEAQKVSREANEAWQGDVRRFEAKRNELTIPGAQEAIETAIATLTTVQQAVIVKAADNPALVLAALGQHPGKLAEIAAIQDPLKQAAAVAKLEGTLKVTKRRQAPDPEQIASGTASVRHGATDKDAERLEKQAQERGGDVSDLLRRNREKRRAAQAK